MPAIDSTAAQLCTALYQFDGYPIVQFDHIIQNEDNDFYVGIKRIGDTDYVVFRGSSDAADWLHNLETFTTYYPGLGGCGAGEAISAGQKLMLLPDPQLPRFGRVREIGKTSKPEFFDALARAAMKIRLRT